MKITLSVCSVKLKLKAGLRPLPKTFNHTDLGVTWKRKCPNLYSKIIKYQRDRRRTKETLSREKSEAL